MSDKWPPGLGTRPWMMMIAVVVMIGSLVLTGFVCARNTVTIVINQEQTIHMTWKTTVQQVIEEAGLTLAPDDQVIPARETAVSDRMTIQVIRALPNEVVEQQTIMPFQVERVIDNTLERGVEREAQPGQDGLKVQKIKISYDQGMPVRSEVVEESIIHPPVNQRILVGTREKVITSRGESHRYNRMYTMEATAYTPYDGSGTGRTATGIQARHGVVAVDPSVIPLGTRVFIPGYGVAVAADTGGAIIGHTIDLCMEDYGDCMAFGRRMIEVYVLE